MGLAGIVNGALPVQTTEFKRQKGKNGTYAMFHPHKLLRMA